MISLECLKRDLQVIEVAKVIEGPRNERNVFYNTYDKYKDIDKYKAIDYTLCDMAKQYPYLWNRVEDFLRNKWIMQFGEEYGFDGMFQGELYKLLELLYPVAYTCKQDLRRVVTS